MQVIKVIFPNELQNIKFVIDKKKSLIFKNVKAKIESKDIPCVHFISDSIFFVYSH